MRAVEFELRVAIVLKGQLFPACRAVAALAIGLSFVQVGPHKLALMNVFVAARAIHGQRLDPDFPLRRAFVFHLVAFEAYDLPMLAFERKTGEFMIERGAVPAVGIVAEFAAVLVNPDIELTAVGILVAALAARIGKCEIRVSGVRQRFMAFHTGHREVAAGQRIF